ncbi:putative cupredoxin-like copper-binding protein [Roseateles toxinivorans]|uniref:Putative cupredoxin-like copper-binding protein n=2 Tax=Roseateles toxinivorans TaxID=270368 RepID=A0A4R6QKL2_9BURK|nr:putative cupredoxin-like copper-binding protein [Roseateles toxinivorans]
MMKMNQHPALLMVAVSLCLMAGTGTAMAHGEKAHAAAPLRLEQKAWGIAAKPAAARRTIQVRMTDAMRFVPDQLTVRQGETVRIVIRNEGAMLHEFVLGTKKELDEHAALMLKFPDMEHDEPYMAHVPAGKSGEIVWTFNRAGDFDFACLIAGHYQAGMVGRVKVVAAKGTKPGKEGGHVESKQ